MITGGMPQASPPLAVILRTERVAGSRLPIRRMGGMLIYRERAASEVTEQVAGVFVLRAWILASRVHTERRQLFEKPRRRLLDS